MYKRSGLACSIIVITLLLIGPIVAATSVAYAQTQPVVIRVGALLALSGDLQSEGERELAAMEFAVQEMNDYLTQKDAWFRLELIPEDTATKPDVAQQKFSSLVAQGVKFIVGLQSSAEAKSVLTLANEKNVLAISVSSTAIELAIPNDNLYRFVPADNVQSKAIVEILRELGVKAAIIVYRADPWGEGLKNAISQDAQSKNIKVVSVYSYNPESPNFPGIVTQLNGDVQNLFRQYKPSEIAVVDLSFNEAAQLFSAASKYPDLKKVGWIGTDGSAGLTEITSDPVAGGFAESTLFLNPLFAPATTQEQEKVSQYVYQKVKAEATAYTYVAHDIIVALALSILKAGPTDDMNQLVNKVKQVLPEVVNSDEFGNYSATGKFPLNAAGDRATADYELWLVGKVAGGYDWVKAGVYYGDQDKVEFLPLSEYGNKTYLQLWQERFSPSQTTISQTGTTVGTTTQTETGAGGASSWLIAAVIIVIVIVAAAFIALRK